MGNIFTVFLSTTVDYFTGSLTAMLGEKIFPPYDSTKPKYLMLFEGLLQFAGVTITADYISSLLTPTGSYSTDMLGMVGIMYFVFLFSPNMKAKLAATHATTKEVLGIN